jgi:hypothetical protein
VDTPCLACLTEVITYMKTHNLCERQGWDKELPRSLKTPKRFERSLTSSKSRHLPGDHLASQGPYEQVQYPIVW